MIADSASSTALTAANTDLVVPASGSESSLTVDSSARNKFAGDLATCLNNVASVLQMQGKEADALPLLRECIGLVMGTQGGAAGATAVVQDSAHLASALNNLALLHAAQGDLEEAERCVVWCGGGCGWVVALHVRLARSPALSLSLAASQELSRSLGHVTSCVRG